MIDHEKLTQAVETHRRTFELLKWLESALNQGFIQFGSVHAFGSDSEAACQWIARHFQNLPPDGRPASPSETDIQPHAHMLATYLSTSFDAVAQPGYRRAGDCSCWCCSWLEALPHLRPKKLSVKDKRRAQRLKLDALRQLALDVDAKADDARLEEIAAGADPAASLALVTYGHQLIRRLRGLTEGPAILALWREFAWDPGGSPKRKFKLRVDDILQAEQRLIEKLTGKRTTG
ncbi:MAG: hypothetical protein HKN47_19325 [Pirellulaceae bacterium]|nr:hypothetical protein [Pirellulaceae bacterium]